MRRELQRIILQYYIIHGIIAFAIGVIQSTYVQFLSKHGLTLFQTHLVNFIFLSVLLVCEVPTGVFADRYGRKLAFLISCFLVGISKIVYAFVGSLTWFIVAEIISGIGVTFGNGAIKAWLANRLHEFIPDDTLFKQKNLEVYTRENLIRNAMLVVAAVVGSRLAEYNGAYPWLLTAVCMFTAGSVSCFALNDRRVPTQVTSTVPVRIWDELLSFNAVFCHLRKLYSVYSVVRANEVVMMLVVMGLAQHFAVQAPSMQWHPFLLQHFPRERELGAVFAGSVFMQFVGVWLAPHLLRHIKDERKTLAVVQLLLGLGIALTTLWSNPVIILFFFGLYQFARGMYMPIKDDYLVRSSPKDERATYISFEAQSHHLGGMVGLLVAGWLGQYMSITGAWVFMGIVAAVSGLKHLFRPSS